MKLAIQEHMGPWPSRIEKFRNFKKMGFEAVELIGRARTAGVPILAVDTPTAVDLTSGDLSTPVVQAHVTVTFHRPKSGLLARRGSAVAGIVLVAPIGIPQEADRG